MAENEGLALALSAEEVMVALSYIDKPPMMGLNVSVMDVLSDEEAALVLGTAERALIAREFLMPGDSDSFTLIDPVVAAVGVCSVPESTLVASFQRPGGPQQASFFHTGGGANVVHTIPLSGIHQFYLAPDRSAFVEGVMALLDLNGVTRQDVAGGEVSEEALSAGRNAARDTQDAAAAATILANGGLPDFTAAALAETLFTPVSNTTMAAIDHRPDEDVGMDGMTILRGQNGVWMLEPIGEGLVRVSAVGEAETLERVVALVKML